MLVTSLKEDFSEFCQYCLREFKRRKKLMHVRIERTLAYLFSEPLCRHAAIHVLFNVNITLWFNLPPRNYLKFSEYAFYNVRLLTFSNNKDHFEPWEGSYLQNERAEIWISSKSSEHFWISFTSWLCCIIFNVILHFSPSPTIVHYIFTPKAGHHCASELLREALR